MSLRRRGSRGDLQIDRNMNIMTGGIEEWEDLQMDYYRFEATPYRALDELLDHYELPPNPFVVDYGCGLGRINFYFHHRFAVPGYGVELHAGRVRAARDNLRNYKAGLPKSKQSVQIAFKQAKAEYHDIDPRANIFYFFNPFSDQIYYDVLGKILDSLIEFNRRVDIIFYYPSTLYIMLMESEPHFKLHQMINLEYSSDPRECFMVYRHEP